MFEVSGEDPFGPEIPVTFDILIVFAIVILALIVVRVLRPQLLGFKGKTLWDWMSLLLVPSLIATATLVVNQVQSQSNQSTIQESAFQQYIDRISNLMLVAKDSAPLATTAVARAHTSAILRIVDHERAGRVLVFLDQLGRLHEFVSALDGIDLTNTELKELRLDGLEFDRVKFIRADLEGTSLVGADLEDADFTSADLKFIVLRDASLENAIFNNANLDYADVRNTDLTSAIGLTSTQLLNACLDETTKLPQYIGLITPTAASCEVEDD